MSEMGPMSDKFVLRQGEGQLSRSINMSVIMGLLLAAAFVFFGACFGGRPLGFLSLEGVLLVLGGTLASTLIQFSLSDLRSALAAARSALTYHIPVPSERIDYLLWLSRAVKEHGILTLEDEALTAADDFLKLGLSLVVDGQSPEEVKRMLRTEMRTSHERAWRSVHVWETMGNFAPAMGLIGTLIGLIQMMGALQDAGTVGPSMSMALIATLYGSVAANLFFFPIAGKLRVIAQEREQCKHITLEGLLSIGRLENPLMLEQRLQSFASIASNS